MIRSMMGKKKLQLFTKRFFPAGNYTWVVPRGCKAVSYTHLIPTLEAIPDENTLSYVNTDGTTINFRIGDDVRVAEDGEYVFYRLYDLAGGKASWQESGSGTALPGNVYLTGANYYNESVRTIKQGYLSNE